jgi:segregation and condensation protein B
MEISNLIPHIESLIFASEKPLTSLEITELINNAFGFMEDKVVADQVDAALEGIVEKYRSEFYPFEVRQSGGGWQFLTKKDFHKTVAQLNGEKFLKRLSAAALETLAIIAYKQPITKGEIETIRGVSTDYTIQKLLEKELIIISGRNEKMPGHPLVYATSKSFMDYFGINTPEDLPKIKEVLAENLIQPTIINHTDFEEGTMVVTDDGELIDQTDAEGDAIASIEAQMQQEEEITHDSEHVSIDPSKEEVQSETSEPEEATDALSADEEQTGSNDTEEEDAEELNEWQEEINDDENIEDSEPSQTTYTEDTDETDRKRDEENNAEEDSEKEDGV